MAQVLHLGRGGWFRFFEERFPFPETRVVVEQVTTLPLGRMIDPRTAVPVTRRLFGLREFRVRARINPDGSDVWVYVEASYEPTDDDLEAMVDLLEVAALRLRVAEQEDAFRRQRDALEKIRRLAPCTEHKDCLDHPDLGRACAATRIPELRACITPG